MTVSDAPLEDERFGGGVRVGNIQIIDAQSINRRRVLIQVDFHGQRCALQNSKSFYIHISKFIYRFTCLLSLSTYRLDSQISGKLLPILANADRETRLWCTLCQ